MSISAEQQFRQLRRKAGRAIGDYDLIEAGDRIAVAVSGGKDSWLLLHVLADLRRRAPVPFELVAVNVDPGFPGYRVDLLEGHLQKLGVRYHLETANFNEIISESRRPGSSYCAFCARLRRGILYTLMDRFGCNKLALGHHLDDLIETLLLNQFYVGRLAAISPRLLADNGRHTVIRPLVYVPEQDIIDWVGQHDLPIICCSCPVCDQSDQKRQVMKRLVTDLSGEIPEIRQSLLKAMSNVQPRHLLDPALLKDGDASQEDDSWQMD